MRREHARAGTTSQGSGVWKAYYTCHGEYGCVASGGTVCAPHTRGVGVLVETPTIGDSIASLSSSRKPPKLGGFLELSERATGQKALLLHPNRTAIRYMIIIWVPDVGWGDAPAG